MDNLMQLRPSPLTVNEAHTLEDFEQVMEYGLEAESFSQKIQGYALKTIKEDGLFEMTGQSWTAYTATRWGIGKAQVNRIIAAAPILEKMEIAQAEAGATPKKKPNEKQSREISKAPEIEQEKIIKMVAEKAKKDGKQPTAKEVKLIVEDAVIVEDVKPKKPVKKEPTKAQKTQFEAVRNFTMNTKGGFEKVAKYFLANLAPDQAKKVCEDLKIKV